MMSCALGAFCGTLAGAGIAAFGAGGSGGFVRAGAAGAAETVFRQAGQPERSGSAAVFLRLRYFFGALSRDCAFSFTQ